MQNKPNLPPAQMNITLCLTNHYKNQQLCRRRRIKPNQTQKQPSTKNLSRQFIGKLPNSHSLIEKLQEHEFKKFKSFLQPVLEKRAALDHICRAMSVVIEMRPPLSSDYVEKNLDKACGHLYRSFFDAAEWLGIILREKIQELYFGYDNDCISTVSPEYYHKIKPGVEQFNTKIATIRNEKDFNKSESPTELVEQVKEYMEQIELLLGYSETMAAAIPSMEEYKKKQKKQRVRDIVTGVIAGLVVAAIIALVTYIFSKNKPQ